MLPKELEIPVELYCASCMKLSPIAQLILAVSAIEAIVGDPPDRPKVELELVAVAIEAVKQAKRAGAEGRAGQVQRRGADQVGPERDHHGDGADHGEYSKSSRDAVLQSLGNLLKVGRRSAGRQLVDAHLPGEGAAFIEVYRYRGQIAHMHDRANRATAAAIVPKAQRLASELIAKLMPKATTPC